MARTPRSQVSRARRGVSVRGERRIVRSPVNGPAAASIARIQRDDTPLGAPSDIMGSSLVPSSGVEVQPEVQTGSPAEGLDVYQSMCMVLQTSRTDLDVLTVAESDATQRPESMDIDAANLQTVFPLEFGNQSPESIGASTFQSYGSLASVLSCGAGNPTSNALNAAPTPPTASDYDFPAALCLGPEVISPLPEILPLEEAEKLHMLDQLFPPEQDQSLENASSLSPSKQLYQPNHLGGPMQMVKYDPPSQSHTSRSLQPLGEMIHHAATHPQSFPFGRWHPQSPQQPHTDLDGDMQKQLLGSAPFHSSPSNEPCAMEYPVGFPPSPNSNVITAIVPNIVEAAPTVNIAPFGSLAQSPAISGLPNPAATPARKIRPDDATVFLGIIDYIKRSIDIQRIKNKLKMLKQQLKHCEQLLAALRNVNPSIHHTNTSVARLLTNKGYTCVDHTHDPWALTAVTTMPAIGISSGLASFLGTNVAINYCHDNYSLTVSSPYLGQAVSLLEPMLLAIQDHHLEVLFASIITTSSTHIYSLQCKASSEAELLRNNLHSVLQGLVNNFPSTSSSQEHHG